MKSERFWLCITNVKKLRSRLRSRGSDVLSVEMSLMSEGQVAQRWLMLEMLPGHAQAVVRALEGP